MNAGLDVFCRLWGHWRSGWVFCEREWEAEGQARSGLALHVIRFMSRIFTGQFSASTLLPYHNMKTVTSFQLAINVYLVGR